MRSARVGAHSRALGFAVVAVASIAFAGPAQAADRSDPIPAAVGPPGGIGFYVNPSAPGLDPARVQSIIQRSLARWGDTFLGLTGATPGASDGLNVIGVASLPTGTLGLAQSSSRNTTTPVAPSQSCVPTPREPSDTVRRADIRPTVRLRRDSLVGRRVRRRTIRRRMTIPKYKRTTSPAIAQLCTLAGATSNTAATPEYDVLLRPSPETLAWQLGPALPTNAQYDFETNTLHELGHVSGLAHQVSECDPATPMPSSQAPAEYWHAVDDWRRPGCPVETPPAPAPQVVNGVDSTEPLPGPGAAALAGINVLVNPRVPAGYDTARFVSVATRAIRRAGGTPAGVTDAAPSSGDGVSVLGFAPLGVGTLSSATRLPRQQILQPYVVFACRKANKRMRRQVILRRTVRRSGRRLRRDLIRTRTRTVSGFTCMRSTRPGATAAFAPEVDLRINQQSLAWEFGPKFPTDGTRWDLETAILQDVMSGLPEGSACDVATPNTSAGASPGDWWRSTAEVQRTRCLSGESNTAASTRRLRSGGATSTVHRAAGLPYDVKLLP